MIPEYIKIIVLKIIISVYRQASSPSDINSGTKKKMDRKIIIFTVVIAGLFISNLLRIRSLEQKLESSILHKRIDDLEKEFSKMDTFKMKILEDIEAINEKLQQFSQAVAPPNEAKLDYIIQIYNESMHQHKANQMTYNSIRSVFHNISTRRLIAYLCIHSILIVIAIVVINMLMIHYKVNELKRKFKASTRFPFFKKVR